MTVMAGSWQEWLDRVAVSNIERPPLRRDPRLWELLAPDRELYPRVETPPCPRCGTPTRYPSARVDEFPGTSPRVLKDGTCRNCYMGNKRTPKRRGTPCAGCGVTMRSSKDRIADYPGTVRHHGRGLCRACYEQATHKSRKNQ